MYVKLRRRAMNTKTGYLNQVYTDNADPSDREFVIYKGKKIQVPSSQGYYFDPSLRQSKIYTPRKPKTRKSKA